MSVGLDATLDLNSFDETIGGLSGSATSQITLGSGTLTTGGLGIDTSFYGEIVGSGGLTKTGTAKLTIARDNRYTGPTTIEDGRLLVTGSLAPESVVTIRNGSTLGGTGTVAGLVTAEAGGTLAPGLTAGLLRTGSVQLSSGSSLAVELNGLMAGAEHDQLDVAGNVDLGGATLDASRDFLPHIGDRFTILSNDGADAVVGTFAGLPEGATLTVEGRDFTISYASGDGNDVVLTAVPTTLYWQGNVDNAWSTPGNWSAGGAPLDGDTLVFDTATAGFADNFTPSNDLVGLSLGSIHVVDDSTTGDFVIDGNAVTIADGITTSGSTGAVVFAISQDLLGAAQAFVLDLDTIFTGAINSDPAGDSCGLIIMAGSNTVELGLLGLTAGGELASLVVDSSGVVGLASTTSTHVVDVTANDIRVETGAVIVGRGPVRLSAKEGGTVELTSHATVRSEGRYVGITADDLVVDSTAAIDAAGGSVSISNWCARSTN